MFICKKCKIEISKERHDKAIAERWLPLCEDCDGEIKEKFKKWYSLFQNMKF
jgi:NAD-dependent SIR2 family protein deacetylase